MVENEEKEFEIEEEPNTEVEVPEQENDSVEASDTTDDSEDQFKKAESATQIQREQMVE